jgi:hypothetical protein
MKMCFNTALSMAWNAVKLNYGLMLGGAAIFMLVQVVISILNAVAQSSSLTTSLFIQLVVGVFFGVAFGTGVSWFGVLVVRGKKPSVSALFSGFTKYWSVTGIGVVIYLVMGIGGAVIAGVIFGVGSLMNADVSASVSWFIPVILFSIAAVIFCFVVVFRLIFAGTICLDPERKETRICSCLKASWRGTGPVYWPILGFYLFLMLLIIISAVALCLPLFFLGIPIMLTGIGATYHLTFTPNVAIEPPAIPLT